MGKWASKFSTPVKGLGEEETERAPSLSLPPIGSRVCLHASPNQLSTFIFLSIDLDIDECQSDQPDNCEQICVNVPGSFFCDCPGGYKLNADSRSCDGKI